MSTAQVICEAAAIAAQAKRLLVLSGAGISAESGLPTFRAVDGLWEGHRVEDVASPAGFARDPLLVWRFYAERRRKLPAAQPNAAHLAIARHAQAHPSTVIATQNVDDLHQRAAAAVAAPGAKPAPAAVPLCLHGELLQVSCTRCGWQKRDTADYECRSLATLPRCQQTGCGGLLRPAVVWFGEALDELVLGAAMQAAARADVCLVVGTSAQVYPAAGLALVALQAGARVIEVNPAETELSSVAIHVPLGAVAAVPQILGAAP